MKTTRSHRPVSSLPAVALLAATALLSVPADSYATPDKSAPIDFSGSADTLLTGIFGTGDEVSVGLEEYANLRLKARVGERATFYGAANFIAASGTPVAASEATSGSFDSALIVGQNYAAAVEPERLYIRVEGESFDLETGLMRLAFGYGQAWSPSDFLSPKNPLLPDARLRGVLALAATAYPTDEWKLRGFAVAGSDAEKYDGTGTILGAAADLHTDQASVQAFYAWEAGEPEDDVHRIGASLKVDIAVGLALDALYTIDGSRDGWEGLGASLGIDYSFLDGDLYALVQYLYNGDGSAATTELTQENYLYGAFIYRFNDYTNATLDFVASLDDASAQPALTVSHEPFQGLTLSLSCRVPVGDDQGELGPTLTGTRLLVTAKVKAKF